MEAIDEHWRKLTILQKIADEDDLFRKAEMILLKKLFDQAMNDEKKAILRKIKDLLPVVAHVSFAAFFLNLRAVRRDA